MTILETERLVRKISGLSSEAQGQAIAPKLAEDYAAACRAANLRLQQCEAMIREGARHQAIQAAETAPNLLDLIAVLEFQGAEQWRQYCEKNGLPVAERIDARSVSTLNDCYAQGISTDHPLYAAYRRAVLTHNDEDALKALQSIVRLNPSDTNAAGELERFDGKVLAAKLQNLEDLVSGAAPEVVLAQVEAIENFGFKTKPEGEAWRKAQALRCAALVDEAAKLKDDSLWLDCLVKLDAIKRLLESSGAQLSPGAREKFETLEAWAVGERTKHESERQYQSRLAEVRQRLQAGEPAASVASLREEADALQQAWEALRSCRQPIPEALTSNVQKRSAELAAEIERRLAAQRRKRNIAVAATLVVLAIVAGFLFVQYQARDLAHELNRAVSERHADTAEKLVSRAHHTLGNSLGLAGLPAAVTAADNFLTNEKNLLKSFQDSFAQLPKNLTGEPTGPEVARISSQLSRARNALAALGPDYKVANESQLHDFEQRWQKFLSAGTAPVNALFERSVTAAEKELDALNYNLAFEQARAHTTTLSNELRQIGEYESDFTNHVKIRNALLERSASVRAKFAPYDRDVRKLDDAIASLQKARNFGDYSNALSVIAGSPFSSSRWSTAAVSVRRISSDDQSVLRSLLGITNDVAWDYVKKEPPPRFIPERDLPAERDIYDHLNDDPSVNADHKRVRLVLDGQNAMEWIVTSTLTRAAQWKSIRVYDPAASPNACTFELRQYGFFDGKYKWSPALAQTVTDVQVVSELHETEAFHSIGLDRAIGPERRDKTLLEVLDALKDSSEGSPVFRAYLFQRLVEIMELQPAQRGLAFAPDIQAHNARIKTLAGGNVGDGDWFVAARVNSSAGKLDEFFGSIKGISYGKQADTVLKLDHEVFKGGLRYVGFVGLDGKPVTLDHSASGEVWGVPASGKPGLIGRTSDSGVSLSKPAMELSPLFILGTPRNRLLDNAGVKASDPSVANALPPLLREPSAEVAKP